MTKFLDNHCKIQQLESRLSKNQYLSNQCLPNCIDAQVFKALKASNQVPKRQIYPNFYHWYILMRQFADRTLDHWIKNNLGDNHIDLTISEVVRLIEQKMNKENPKSTSQQTNESQKSTKSIDETTSQRLNQKEKHDDSQQLSKAKHQLKKVCSLTEKPTSSHDDSVTEYLMSIKVTYDVNLGIEDVRKFFNVQNVKLQSIRITKEPSDQGKIFYVRVYFETSTLLCEELKNSILECSSVQSIQCKKQRRNHSL